MANRLPTFALLAVAASAGVALSLWQGNAPETDSTPWRFTAMNGNTVTQDDYPADAVLLNFWATWCPPCLRELPLLSELDQSTPNDELRVLAVAYDNPNNINMFLLENPLALDIAHGFEDVKAYMTAQGNVVGSLPFSVLLDRNGKVLNSHLGELLPETLPAFLGDP